MKRTRLHEQVDRAAELYDEEVRRRAAGRLMELEPQGLAWGANAEFARADELREERLALLRRCSLI